MFLKILLAALILYSATVALAIADCGMPVVTKNDPLISFVVLEDLGHEGAVEIRIEKREWLDPDNVTFSFFIGDKAEALNGVASPLDLKDEGDYFSGWVEFFSANKDFTVRVIVQRNLGWDCEELISNQWKHGET